VKALAPDVVLMDINMPDLNGIEATQQVLAVEPDIGVIMLTMLEDDDSLFAAMCAGARGYILKGADKAEVLKTIRAVAGGEALFGPAIAGRLTAFFQNSRGVARQNEIASPFPDLTDREREVLDLIAQGLASLTGFILNIFSVCSVTSVVKIKGLFGRCLCGIELPATQFC
jgi:DNA-binding NarL/FixJ family response regulator